MSIHTIYFSATGNTKKVVAAIAQGISGDLCIIEHNFTLPSGRETLPAIVKGDIAIIGTPVYAGRVPNLLLKYLKSLEGNGAFAVPVVTYGNRNYDDALIELNDLLIECKFKPVAAAAFSAQHSFSNILAAGRPNADDLAEARAFGKQIYQILLSAHRSNPQIISTPSNTCNEFKVSPSIPGRNAATRTYYQPKDANGNPIDIRKVKPKTTDNCTGCGHCSAICPMGAIDSSDFKSVTGICIKCNACIKECPQEAKYFDDAGYLFHKQDLENRFQAYKTNTIILPE